MKQWIQNIRKRGFTLIETLVAITILVTATAGPMVVASQGAQLGRHTQNQMLASYLAQDAIEYVRYVIATRSNNDFSQSDVINTSYLDRCTGTNVCQIDTSLDFDSTAAISVCSSGNCEDLRWNPNPTKEVYDYTGASTTGFNREVRVRNTNDGPGSDGSILPSDTEYTISVKVWWDNKTESLEVADRLVDWRVVF